MASLSYRQRERFIIKEYNNKYYSGCSIRCVRVQRRLVILTTSPYLVGVTLPSICNSKETARKAKVQIYYRYDPLDAIRFHAFLHFFNLFSWPFKFIITGKLGKLGWICFSHEENWNERIWIWDEVSNFNLESTFSCLIYINYCRKNNVRSILLSHYYLILIICLGPLLLLKGQFNDDKHCHVTN